MGAMVIPFVIFILVVAILMVVLMGGDSDKKKQGPKIIGCPPGFNPSLAYMEKYGETGIAYDEKQKLLCVLHQGTNQSRILSSENILAAAIFEEGVVLAKSVRSDDQGKEFLASLLTDEIKTMFQDAPEAFTTNTDGVIKPTSQSIELKMLINEPDNPVQVINFLNMEAKKGGLIYNEASSHAKNWQELVSFLIRQAGKPTPAESHQPVSQSDSKLQRDIPPTLQQPSPNASAIS